MPQVKFLHCADIHLDTPFTGSRLTKAQAALRRSELKETLLRIVRLAREEQVDLLLISGDLWEQGYIRRQTVQGVNDLLGSLAPARVFIAPGNHDPYLHNSFYSTFSWADNVHIFRGGPSGVELPELGATVYGYGFVNYETREPVLKGFKAANRDVINLLVAHCEVVRGEDYCSPYLAVDRGSIPGMGMDYLALGHIHQKLGELWPTGRAVGTPIAGQDGGGLWAYPGSPEPLGFDEPGEHGVILGQVTKAGGQARVAINWVPMQQRSYTNLEVDITGAETPETVVTLVSKALQQPGLADAKSNFYRITLIGRTEPGLVLEEQVLAAALSGEFYGLRLQNKTCPAYDLEGLGSGQDLVGAYIRKMVELLAQREARRAEGEGGRDNAGGGFREEGPDPEVVRKALYYGLDALLRGEVQVK